MISNHALSALSTSVECNFPFPHWIIRDTFEPLLLNHLNQIESFDVDFNFSDGKRIANNQSRVYLNPFNRNRIQVFDEIANIFEDPSVIQLITQLFSFEAQHCKCRIEYCIDKDGFWLEPHTDITEKKLTIIVYTGNITSLNNLSDCGTDLYNEEKEPVKRIPYIQNTALIFKPSKNTWHGFEKRKITDSRKVLIVNYVSPEWVDTYQLTR